MGGIAKILIVSGLVLLGLGLVMAVLNKIPGWGRLPGDIMVKRDNFTFYAPLTTCILVSLLVSLLMILFMRR